jgi:hypothetical protein
MRMAADKILVTVGRKPATDGWGLEELDLDRDGLALRIDDQCRTSMRGVYAIGDVTGEPMLAHRAMAQGEMVAEIVAGHRRSWDKRCIPAVCFTDPEIVTAGLDPEEARRAGREIRLGQFPFTANGRAMTLAAEDGFVRVVARADNNVVLGIQAVGTGVSELSAAFALAIEMGARLEDIAGTIHAHPTESEAFHGSRAQGPRPPLARGVDEHRHPDAGRADAADHIGEKRLVGGDVPAVIGCRLANVIGHQRGLVRPHGLDDLDEARVGVALDVELAAGKLAAHQLGQFEHVGAPYMALVGARVHGDAVGPGLKRHAAQTRYARPWQVAPIAQIGNGIDIDGQPAGHMDSYVQTRAIPQAGRPYGAING